MLRSLRSPSLMRWLPVVLAAGALQATGCMDDKTTKGMAAGFEAAASRPDELPVVLNQELPFRYPAALYARRVQGNVTLHIRIDRDGKVIPDSTRVEESSGYGSLDSSAVRGARELRFVPAKLRGEPMAVSILFPVYFRHPEAPALPGDTILRKRPALSPAPAKRP